MQDLEDFASSQAWKEIKYHISDISLKAFLKQFRCRATDFELEAKIQIWVKYMPQRNSFKGGFFRFEFERHKTGKALQTEGRIFGTFRKKVIQA